MQCKGLGRCPLPFTAVTSRPRNLQPLPRPLQYKVVAALQHRQDPLTKKEKSVSGKVESSAAVLSSLLSLEALWASSAHAVEEAIGTAEAAATTSKPFLNGAEIVLISLPPVLYGIFSLYRSQVNNQAKLSDFLSIIAAAVIIGNIVSVLVFKVRIY